MLDFDRAVTLLIEHELLDRSEVIDGELQLIDASRRNRNLHLLRRRGPSYMIKEGLGRERRATVTREATIYASLKSLRRTAIARLIPPVLAFFPDECVLVTEMLPAGSSLEQKHARRRRLCSRDVRRLALALASVHRATACEEIQMQFGQGRDLPWPLRALHCPSVALCSGISNGSLLALRMIQREGLSELLERTTAEWTPECLIHGDLRFDNWVLGSERGLPGEEDLRLVDWELALWGDPCWDAGAVLASYLASWLLSCPISGETPPEAVIHLARFRFVDMQRAAGAFWSTYREAMRATRTVSLPKAMRFAAVHLLQRMVEELQPSAVLTGRAVCLAQLAHNLLERPEEAASHFLMTASER